MGSTNWLAESRVLIVAGKGGVGKTTVSAALARAAAQQGRSVLLVGLDRRQELAALLGSSASLTYEPTVLDDADTGTDGTVGTGTVAACLITPEDALLDYLDDKGMRRVARRFIRTGAIEILATTTPGIKDLLVLGKIRQLEESGRYDLIVVDAPAAGHAVTFLRAPRAIDEMVAVGPLHTQATEALAFLSDPRRCQVVLVTLPEETPVNELIETAFDLEDELDLTLAPVVVNACWPDSEALDAAPDELARRCGTELTPADAAALAAAGDYARVRCDRQRAQIERLDETLPLPRLVLGRRFVARLTPTDIEALADELARSES